MSSFPVVLNHIGIIGDVHGEADFLAAALDALQTLPVPREALFCTGDVPGKVGAGDTDRCCHLLEAAGVMTVRGNHDRWALTEWTEAVEERSYGGTETYWRYAESLPATRLFETPFGSAMLCHGLAGNDMEGIYPGGEDEPIRRALKERRLYGWYRLLCAGHTHRRMVRNVGSVILLNPGTLRHTESPGFLTADFEEGIVQFFDIEPETYAVRPAETITLRFDEALH